MAVEVPENKKISQGGKNGKKVGSAIHQRSANGGGGGHKH